MGVAGPIGTPLEAPVLREVGLVTGLGPTAIAHPLFVVAGGIPLHFR